jgi:CheY-like chemotaxis protein
MEEMLRRLIGEHVALVFRPAPRLGRILADPGQVEQVVMNLCVNARDAMPDGGVIEIETTGAADGRVRLSVRDTGSGMTPEVKAHLFEPFFTTKGPGKGTGLGLSTVYGIVHQSGGEITCASSPGAGTTFVISFPWIPEPQAESGEAGSCAPSGGSETILVVEDDEALRQLINQVLCEAGYTVLGARSAEEARTLTRGEPRVQLLVTDLVLPGTNGRRLAEELRRTDPRLAVLMISGYTADTLDDYEMLAGSTAFLQKPFLPEDLHARVRSLLDDAAKHHAAAPPAG